MTFCYLASFDLEDRRNDLGTITFSRSGSSSFILNLQSGVAGDNYAGTHGCSVYNHYPEPLATSFAEDMEETPDTLAGSTPFLAFDDLIRERMRDAANTASWPNPTNLDCSFSLTSHRYEFEYAGDAFSGITFSNAAARRLFGFATNFSGSSATVTGTLTPHYVIQPVLSDVSTNGDEGVNFEPGGLSISSVSDYGTVFGITRPVAPLLREWTQQGETKAKAMRLYASSAHPFTHQELFENCRSLHPFVVSGGFGDGRDYVFKLLPASSIWSQRACKRAGGEMDDALFDISYRAQVLGCFP